MKLKIHFTTLTNTHKQTDRLRGSARGEGEQDTKGRGQEM